MQSTYDKVRFDDVDGATQQDDDETQDWFDGLMRRPRLLLAMLGLCTASEWIAVTPMGQGWIPGDAAWVAEWVRVLAMGMFVCWSVSVLFRDGPNRLLGLWAAWLAGWALVVGWVAWFDPALVRTGLAFNQMLVPYGWWATMGAPFTPGECYVALAVLALVLDVCAGAPCAKFAVALFFGCLARIEEAF
jgi:hypothetical protein